MSLLQVLFGLAVVLGTLLRGLSALAIFYAPSYEWFLLLEFVGGVGISVFNTGSSVIIADMSGTQNRPRRGCA